MEAFTRAIQLYEVKGKIRVKKRYLLDVLIFRKGWIYEALL
jgi:hypothetical protein